MATKLSLDRQVLNLEPLEPLSKPSDQKSALIADLGLGALASQASETRVKAKKGRPAPLSIPPAQTVVDLKLDDIQKIASLVVPSEKTKKRPMIPLAPLNIRPEEFVAIESAANVDADHLDFKDLRIKIDVFLKDLKQDSELSPQHIEKTIKEISSLLLKAPCFFKKREEKKNFDLVLKQLIEIQTFCQSLPQEGLTTLDSHLKTLTFAIICLSGGNPISLQDSKSLGAGGFASVKTVRILDKDYAAKTSHSKANSSLEREFQALRELDHPSILRLFLADDSSLYLELAEYGSLKSATSNDLINDKETFDKVLYQIADGLDYMHQKGFLHGDIKRDNILITSGINAKISDMGTVIKAADFTYDKKMVETSLYSPPEHHRQELGKENCQTIDTWCFGLLLWESLKDDSYQTPFVNEENPKGKHSTQSLEIELNISFQGFSREMLQAQLDPQKVRKYDPNGIFLTIIERCLSLNQVERPSMQQIKELILSSKK